MIRQEVKRWPGVKVTFRHRRKHRSAVFEFNGQSKFLIYPASPSDVKGALNARSTVRKIMRDLGA